MAQPLVALGVNNTMPDALGSYQHGAQAAQTEQHNQIANASQTAELLGSGALYAMGGDINGEVDPQKYHEVLDSFQQMGIDTSKYRDNPNYAKVFANAAVSYMQRAQIAQSDRDYALNLKKFDWDIQHGQEQLALERQQETRLAAGETRRAPPGYEWSPDGTKLDFIPGGPADPENPRNKKVNLTEGQAKTAGFTNRMVKAESLLTTPDADSKTAVDKADPTASGLGPWSSGWWTQLNRQYGPNVMQSPEYQRYLNAAQEWVRAKLRKESGAAISDSEWVSEFKTYFPQPGDDQTVIQQKAQLRANATESMKAESRGGYKALFEDGGQGVGAREIDVSTPNDGWTVEEQQ